MDESIFQGVIEIGPYRVVCGDHQHSIYGRHNGAHIRVGSIMCDFNEDAVHEALGDWEADSHGD